MAAQRVDVEAGLGESELFFPPARATRSDWLAGAELRVLAIAHWTCKTRPSSCVKNTVVLADGQIHPVHWLEYTVAEFYKLFLDEGNHYYDTELLLRRLPDDTSAGDVRAAFQQWQPARVNPMNERKYFYVRFASVSSCTTALGFAQAPGFALKALVSRRPLMGITAFSNERPVFVQDVTTVSCVCCRCQGFILIFDGLMKFQYWDEVCPSIWELVGDIKQRALPFSPSVHTLLAELLCAPDPTTTFLHKKCMYGECTDCGWAVRFEDLKIKNHIRTAAARDDDMEAASENEMKDGDDKSEALQPVFVVFKAYEHVSELNAPGKSKAKDIDEDEAVPKKSSRPVQVKQTLSPSSFLTVFVSALKAFQKHRY
jgi:hypothetical protein